MAIWKLDRLGRSLGHLIALVSDFEQRQIGLLSLNDPMDTTTAQGRLIFRIFASLAEFEQEVIQERTLADLASARRRWQLLGRPKGLSKAAQQKARIAESLYKEATYSMQQIAQELNIPKLHYINTSDSGAFISIQFLLKCTIKELYIRPI